MTNDQGTSETSKRPLSASAPENEQKRPREDECPPAWAINLFSQMKHELTNIIDDRMSRLERVHEEVNERCDDIEARMDGMEDRLKKAEDDVASLQAENTNLKGALAESNDRGMRNSLTICNVRKGPNEKYMAHTRQTLAAALAKITPVNNDYEYWVKAIERAHRGKQVPGKVPVIHVRILNWQDWDLLVNLFRKPNHHNPDKLEIYEMYSEHTNQRRKLALALRKEKIKEFPGCKVHLKYPANLFVKKDGEERFTCVARF